MERWILHVDMDAFYAAVEQLDHPELKGKPVVVGGLGPRGVVATASYEARRYGIRSAMPMAKARQLCPHAVFLAPRFDRYEEVSTQIHNILRSYSPLLEPVSLDEAFLDLMGTPTPEEIAEEIHHRIPKETGLSCSVGLGPNKLVAKLASDSAKPGGLRIVRPEEVDGFLAPLPVEKLWGVGPQTAKKLEAKGIRTVADLRQAGLSLLCSWFGPRFGHELWQLAHGQDDAPVTPIQEPRSFSQEETFDHDLYDPRTLEAKLHTLAHKVATRLRSERYLAGTVRIKVRYADFSTHTRQLKLPVPVDEGETLAEAAQALLSRLGPNERGVRLLGVAAADLVPATFRALPLFPPTQAPRSRTRRKQPSA